MALFLGQNRHASKIKQQHVSEVMHHKASGVDQQRDSLSAEGFIGVFDGWLSDTVD